MTTEFRKSEQIPNVQYHKTDSIWKRIFIHPWINCLCAIKIIHHCLTVPRQVFLWSREVLCHGLCTLGTYKQNIIIQIKLCIMLIEYYNTKQGCCGWLVHCFLSKRLKFWFLVWLNILFPTSFCSVCLAEALNTRKWNSDMGIRTRVPLASALSVSNRLMIKYWSKLPT